MNLDLIVPCRPGQNEELRFAARSWVTNLPHDRLVIAGSKPAWLTGCTFLLTQQTTARNHSNALRNLRAALTPDVTDDVILANDDMFAVQPIDDIPTLHRGPLAEVVEAATDRPRRNEAAAATLDLLHDLGFTDPLCYDLHVPSVANRAALLDVLDRIRALAAPSMVDRIWWRTVYGNLTDAGGDYSPDVKVRSMADPLPAGPFVSTSDATFIHGQAGRDLRARFRTPCRYERGHQATGGLVTSAALHLIGEDGPTELLPPRMPDADSAS